MTTITLTIQIDDSETKAKLETIMTTQAELAEQLAAQTQLVKDLTDQTERNAQEVADKIAALEAAVTAGGTLSAEVETALAELKTAGEALRTKVQEADDAVT